MWLLEPLILLPAEHGPVTKTQQVCYDPALMESLYWGGGRILQNLQTLLETVTELRARAEEKWALTVQRSLVSVCDL